jgi:hypothetical protein
MAGLLVVGISRIHISVEYSGRQYKTIYVCFNTITNILIL